VYYSTIKKIDNKIKLYWKWGLFNNKVLYFSAAPSGTATLLWLLRCYLNGLNQHYLSFYIFVIFFN